MRTSTTALLYLRSTARMCLLAALLSLTCAVLHGATADTRTRNVFLIISDGLRWQEVFHGADDFLLSTNGGVKDVGAARTQFWRESAEERREVLFPFLWEVVAKQGQILGNQVKGSTVKVIN